jgi:hypothetical protein
VTLYNYTRRPWIKFLFHSQFCTDWITFLIQSLHYWQIECYSQTTISLVHQWTTKTYDVIRIYCNSLQSLRIFTADWRNIVLSQFENCSIYINFISCHVGCNVSASLTQFCEHIKTCDIIKTTRGLLQSSQQFTAVWKTVSLSQLPRFILLSLSFALCFRCNVSFVGFILIKLNCWNACDENKVILPPVCAKSTSGSLSASQNYCG